MIYKKLNSIYLFTEDWGLKGRNVIFILVQFYDLFFFHLHVFHLNICVCVFNVHLARKEFYFLDY